MNRGGRVTGRTRFTSYGVLTTKFSKGALFGASDRNKRGIVVPLAFKNRTESTRRGVSTVDVLAFTSAIRGVSLTQPLFEKVGVMRYDPLKKNVVRPFRALFSFVFGLVRGVVHSALTLGVTPLRHLLLMKKSKSTANDLKTKSAPIEALSVTPLPLNKTLTSHPTPVVESHPLRCFKRSASEVPRGPINRHRRGRSDAIGSSSRDIAEVLKTYNTSESRDRLISKLENMKSSATECIKSLSQRNSAERPSLTRRELLMCQQEMVQLSKQLSGLRKGSCSPSSGVTRSHSVMERPKTSLSLENWRTSDLSDRLSLRPESQPLTPHTSGSCLGSVKEMTMKNATDAERETRSENLRMKLKQHEHMVNALKSKYAALSIPREIERRHGMA